MNVYTYILSMLLILSVSEIKIIHARSTYDNPSFSSDRDENLSPSASHQKKRVATDEAFHEDQAETFERSGPLYESRYRKFESDPSFSRHENRLEKAQDGFDESKMQKRDFYESSNNKDASIEVILDPRAKKAVAVVENSPTGQAMYDLTSWKNKDENTFESDQYVPDTQEQVVNLVYPAERNDRKYATFDANSDYLDKKVGFKDKIINDRNNEDTHKKKRNVETIKQEKETEKRNSQEKTKRKSSDQASQTKSDPKQSSNECPPHNTPSSAENENKEKINKEEKTVKRETSQWTQEQLTALKNSLAHVKDSSGEVQNLRNILSSMGLIDSQVEMKRDAGNEDANAKEKREETNNDNKSDSEDEDLNQGNIVLKRNNREIAKENEEDVIKSGAEPIEKREVNNENNYEIEDGENAFSEKKDVKRSNSETETDKKQSRKKRQDSENIKNSEKNEKTLSETETDKNSDSKKYTKRETNSENTRDIRKNRENKETEEEYERRMENQIQTKIDAIKEKVKREILEEQRKRNKRSDELNTSIRKRRQSKEETKTEKEDEEKSQIRRKRANILPEKQMIYQAYQTDQDGEAEEDGEFDDNAYDGRMYVEKRQAAEDESDYYDPVRKREVENYLRQYYPETRNRRSFEDSSAFHGSRRVLKNKNYADTQNQEEFNENNENSDNEYFGSLPQTYNGELTRYKRVKRDDPYK